ncbi:aminotransferase class I/II-fold pyridoxal phosphate-dependent enzyme [Siminovitchia sediminis]|uniref:Aminotransferase class I/II-fold pyridoxal phosphate-dependent enzyme n=1 Tax=Siminovitchia sediminis TaxID=1274353 RepID=A0ABW4KKW3_9BACI
MIRATKKEKIHLSTPHLSGSELEFVREAFDTNWVAPVGPHLEAFEREASNFLGVKEAVALNSGTSAIHLALALLGVKRGDTVFCSTLTFIASANPILYQGAEPVFIDSEPDTWNMSPAALKKALEDAGQKGKLPKAVIVVHLYGQSAKMDEILCLCNQYDIPVIEDAAESLGSRYKQKPSGTMGKLGIFSFNGNKIITTSGGGMLVSNDAEAIRKAKFLATQAKDPAPYYQHSCLGFNYRMSNVLAGIGRAQLKVLKERVSARRDIFSSYLRELSFIPGIEFMPELEGTFSNRWLTAMLLDEKQTGISSSTLMRLLAEANIEARPVWKPLHLQPLFEGTLFYSHEEMNVSEYLFRNGLCLPSGSNMKGENFMRVIQFIKKALKVKV